MASSGFGSFGLWMWGGDFQSVFFGILVEMYSGHFG